jgi:hypothetical protein
LLEESAAVFLGDRLRFIGIQLDNCFADCQLWKRRRLCRNPHPKVHNRASIATTETLPQQLLTKPARPLQVQINDLNARCADRVTATPEPTYRLTAQGVKAANMAGLFAYHPDHF